MSDGMGGFRYWPAGIVQNAGESGAKARRQSSTTRSLTGSMTNVSILRCNGRPPSGTPTSYSCTIDQLAAAFGDAHRLRTLAGHDEGLLVSMDLRCLSILIAIL